MWGSEWTSASGGQVEGITFVRVSSLKFHLKQMGKLRPGGVDLSPSLTEALFRASLTARPFSAHRGACPGRARSPPAPHPSSRIRSTWRLIPKLGLPRAVLKCCWTALRSFTQGALWSISRDGLTRAGRGNETGRGWRSVRWQPHGWELKGYRKFPKVPSLQPQVRDRHSGASLIQKFQETEVWVPRFSQPAAGSTK